MHEECDWMRARDQWIPNGSWWWWFLFRLHSKRKEHRAQRLLNYDSHKRHFNGLFIIFFSCFDLYTANNRRKRGKKSQNGLMGFITFATMSHWIQKELPHLFPRKNQRNKNGNHFKMVQWKESGGSCVASVNYISDISFIAMWKQLEIDTFPKHSVKMNNKM